LTKDEPVREALLKKVEDLEDMLVMKESLSAPEEEAINLEDYERQRASSMGGCRGKGGKSNLPDTA